MKSQKFSAESLAKSAELAFFQAALKSESAEATVPKGFRTTEEIAAILNLSIPQTSVRIRQAMKSKPPTLEMIKVRAEGMRQRVPYYGKPR